MKEKFFCWRSAHEAYFDKEDPLPFEYTRSNPGRWHSEGSAIIYTSQTPALSAIEIIQYTSYEELSRYYLLKIEVKSDSFLEIEGLPSGWVCNELSTKIIGDRWLEAQGSLTLLVPSAVSNLEKSILINPEHPHFEEDVNVVDFYRWDEVSKLMC